MKDPADSAYRCAPAYFVRAFRAVAPQANAMGMRAGDRRDRVRTAADPGLCAGRARRLVQAAGAGRHAAGPGDPRLQGARDPDAPELDPGATRRTAHLRRLPQPAARRIAELRRDRQRAAGGADAGDGGRAPVRRDDGVHAHAHRRDGTEPRHRPRPCRQLGRHEQGRRHRAPGHRRALHRQHERRRRPRDTRCLRTASSTTPITSSRCGRAAAAPAAPTPAPPATATRRSWTCAPRSPVPDDWCRTRNCWSATR